MTSTPDGETYFDQQPRKISLRLAFLLYITLISVEAIRKVSGLPAGIDIMIYVIVGTMYLLLLPGITSRLRLVPYYLPLWMTFLTAWCVMEAFLPRIPLSMAVLGSASYAFFVPLFYIGAELLASDNEAAKIFRFVSLAGGLIGLGALASAVLGPSASAILQPITPGVGLHSFSTGNVYLAPSFFASGEQAAEELLIALFAWIALVYLPSGRMRRAPTVILGILIAVGLFATQRRADIVVAVLGITVMLLLNRLTGRGKAVASALGTRAQGGFALLVGVIGSIILLDFLGASKALPFLTSKSNALSALTLMFSPLNPASLGGQGTGTSAQGAGIFGATTFTGIRNYQHYAGYIQGGRAFITVEGGMTKTWLELGLVGVVLYGGVFLSVLGPAIRSLGRLDRVGRALTILAIALGIVFLKGHASLDDPMVQPLFWLTVGGIWGRLRGPAARSSYPATRSAHTTMVSGFHSPPMPGPHLG